MPRRNRTPVAVLVSLAMVGGALALLSDPVAAATDPRVTEVVVTDALDPHSFAAIAAAPDGHLWLADAEQPVLTSVDTSGNVVASIDLRPGGDPGGLLSGGFADVAVAPDGAVWATSPDDHLVLRADPSVSPVSVSMLVPSSGAAPAGIAVVSATEVRFVGSDIEELDTVTYDPDSGSLSQEGAVALPSGSAPAGIALGPDGSTWVALSGESHVLHLSEAGTVLATYDTAVDPRAIAVEADGDAWYVAGMGASIGRIDPVSGTTSQFTMSLTANPRDVVVGPDGHAWFSDAGRSRIGRATASGTITTFQMTAPAHVGGIAVGTEGRVWTTSTESVLASIATDVTADAAPTVTGTTTEGQVLSHTSPTLRGTPPIVPAAGQWRRCAADGSACTDIPGATGDTYALTADDAGHAIVYVLRATNPAGTSSFASDATATVAALPPPPPPPAVDPAPQPAPPEATGPTPEQIRQFMLVLFFMAVLKAQQAKKKCTTVYVRVKGKRVARQVCRKR